MTTWPSTNKAVTTTTDADSDSISGARVDINKSISNVNDIIDMFDIPATPTDNYILVYDTASATFKVEENTASGGGLANPADADLDMANYNIIGVNEIIPEASQINIRTTSSLTSNSIQITGVTGGVQIKSPDSDLKLWASGEGSQILLQAPYTAVSSVFVLASFTVAGLPTMYPTAGIAYCTNETGGACVVFFDGTNWRRVTDRAVAS